MVANLARRHFAIEVVFFTGESLPLDFAGGDDLFAHGGAVGAAAVVGEFTERDRRNFDVNVYPIKQRPADAAEITFDLHRIAFALSAGIAAKSAGAGVCFIVVTSH